VTGKSAVICSTLEQSKQNFGSPRYVLLRPTGFPTVGKLESSFATDDGKPTMPQPNNFYRRLKRAKAAFLTGTAGAASDVRIIDPRTGQVIQTKKARRYVFTGRKAQHQDDAACSPEVWGTGTPS